MSKPTERSFKAVKHFERHPTKMKRKPMRSHKEMAKEFGISEGALSKRLIDHPELNPPPYMLTGQFHYYDPVEMRKWLKRYNDMQNNQSITGK